MFAVLVMRSTVRMARMERMIAVEGRAGSERRCCRHYGRRRVDRDQEQPAKSAQRLGPHRQSLPPSNETHQARFPTEGEYRGCGGPVSPR